MRISMIGVKGMPHPGGIESVVEQLGSRLVERGHEVTVYVRPHYTPATSAEYRGMRLIHLPSVPTKHLDAITHTFLATLHVLWSGADIAHIHSIGLSIFALLTRLRGIKTVVQSHGLDWQREKWGVMARTFLRMTDYTAVTLPDATTVVSRKMQRYYQDRFGRQVIYIPSGVSHSEKVPAQEICRLGLSGNDYILFMSRLVPEKGCHYLVQAYNQLHCPGKKLVIAGDSNYGDRYAAELKKQGNENILFLGFVRGRLLQELLSHAYLYVLPSEIEGLSLSLLDAMSCGNCVLVSDIEENLEVIEDSGFSFKSKDIQDLKSKLEHLLSREDMVRQYRDKARTHVHTHYDWERVTDQYESLYQGLIGK